MPIIRFDSIVAGIDIGFRHTGIVIAGLVGEDTILPTVAYCINTAPEAKKHDIYVATDDIMAIQKTTKALIDYLWKDGGLINLIAVEVPSAGAKSSRAARALGIATGTIGALTATFKQSTVWILPHQVKRYMCDKLNATKEEIDAAVITMWPEVERFLDDAGTKEAREHIADAAAVLLAARDSGQYKMLISLAKRKD